MPLVGKFVNGKLFLQFTSINYEYILVIFGTNWWKWVQVLLKIVKNLNKNGKMQ